MKVAQPPIARADHQVPPPLLDLGGQRTLAGLWLRERSLSTLVILGMTASMRRRVRNLLAQQFEILIKLFLVRVHNFLRAVALQLKLS